ncbi:hypothetical protein [Leptospira stimsonii]|uniref:Fibronectin type-III domain-containing protein n=1 Tax=Leptospira stimsonii TaxID=2202203 RepID=A0ABY2MW49_9LEPT|nr:hypothetical protein [Leptospira stimsonii]TGK14613.1 hypothetical protein EHO98_17330 [Leptospira stimsonii]TGM10036.1 hypothetical protein EHQ90_20285 [Leptospira stimsonii]
MRNSNLLFLNFLFVIFGFFGCNPGPGSDSSGLVGLLSSTFSGENGTPIGGNPPTGDVPGWVSASDAIFADKVEITWEPVANAQQYKVMRKASNEAAFQQVAILSGTSFTDTAVSSEKTYQYVVQALTNQNKNTPQSLFDTGWKSFSAGCSDTLKNAANSGESLLARLNGGFSSAGAIAVFRKNLLVGDSAGVVLLNENRDLIGIWPGVFPKTLIVDKTKERIYALSGRDLLRLTSECGTELLTSLPDDSFPTDLAIDTTGNLYVSEVNHDTLTDRIFKFDLNGTPLNTFDLPGQGREPVAIHIHPVDNSILVADNFDFNLYRFQINGNQLVQIAFKHFTAGRVIDLTMPDSVQIIVVIQYNGNPPGPMLIRNHNGMGAGSVDIPFFGSVFTASTINAVTFDSESFQLLATGSDQSILGCSYPTFSSCQKTLSGLSPSQGVTDSNGNIYILNSSYISKLNSNGAHLGVFPLPNFAGLSILGLDLELDRDFLYVSAKNFDFQKTVLLKVKTDFSTFTSREIENSNAFFSPQIAVSESKIYNDIISGDLSSARIRYAPIEGGTNQSYENVFNTFFISDVFSLETDNAGHLYYHLTDFDEELNQLGRILRFDLDTLGWKALDSSAYDTNVHYQIGTDLSGNLYTLDFLTGGFKIVKRDSEFLEKKRISLPQTMNPITMFLSGSGESAFVIDSKNLHRFTFSK